MRRRFCILGIRLLLCLAVSFTLAGGVTITPIRTPSPPPKPAPSTSPTTTPSTNPASPTTQAVKLPPPPDAAALKNAMQLVEAAFKIDLAEAKTTEQKAAVAARIFAEASQERDPAAIYALLLKAKDIAIQGRDLVLVSSCIQAMESAYDVDSIKLMAEALPIVAADMRSADDRVILAGVALEASEKALLADRYEPALSDIEIGVNAARGSENPDLQKQMALQSRALREAQTAFNGLKASLALLAKTPNDPDANLKVGKFRCFIKGDWKNGLPMLIQGSDNALRDLAQKESAVATDAAAAASIADGWWDYAQPLTGSSKYQVERHAVELYRQALPSLTGLANARAQQNIKAYEALDKDLVPQPKTLTLTIEAYIASDAELHITATGIYWKSNSHYKIGYFNHQFVPTYVNGKAWQPQWDEQRTPRSAEHSDTLRMFIGEPNFTVEVLAVAPERGVAGIETRDPVTISKDKSEQTVTIPDHQPGSRWYTIRLTREKK